MVALVASTVVVAKAVVGQNFHSKGLDGLSNWDGTC